ncbi:MULTISPECIES: hypothetical protein [unclassified Psychrobacter]|uniref:hypothetical protein n=1 Tax=unclassified Psychrobacter TaxID=196806 RepID=UPI003FD665CE
MVIKSIILFLFFCLAVACSSEVKQPFSSDYLYSADPTADALKAISKGNLHVYATYSGGPYTPEIKRGCVSDDDIVPIIGTTHGYENYKQHQFNILADLYAKYYNFQIKAYLIRNGDKCLSWAD